MKLWVIAAALAAPLAFGDVTGCACDLASQASMSARECSLCREAEKQAADTDIFFLKDINPRKPNRWLALPRVHGPAGHPLHKLDAAAQTRLWKAAITKAKDLWGGDWGIAYNSEKQRTQCHGHVHIGKLMKGLAPGKYYDVDRPEQIRLPADGTGIWFHPVGNKLRVHTGEGITETALMR